MILLWSSLLIAVQFSPSDDCIYDGISSSDRQIIGEAVLAKETTAAADLTKSATDRCARENRWSTPQALQMNGYASMRFAADVLAGKFGKPGWSSSALHAIREWPLDRVRTLAGTNTDTDNAAFKLVLTQMIGADRTLPDAVQAMDKADLESFVLIIKLNAVAELVRRGG